MGKQVKQERTLPTQEGKRTIRKKLKKTPSSSPALQVAQLQQQILQNTNISWVWRMMGYKSNPQLIASLWEEIAKAQVKLQQQEDAGQAYIEAAEQWEEAKLPAQAVTCRKQAAQSFAALAGGPSATEQDTKRNRILLCRAIEQLQLMQSYYEEEAQWNLARKTAEQKAQHYLKMGMYQDAADTYFHAASRLSQARVEQVNRCLIFCTACRILADDDDLARASWTQALKNYDLARNGKKQKGWSKDCCMLYVLCTLYLLDLPTAQAEWNTALSQVKRSHKGLTQWLEAVEAAVENEDHSEFGNLSEASTGRLDGLLFSYIRRAESSFQ